jgi:hypothetical protein
VAHAAAVGGLAGVWLYQGLVPKLLRADADEVAMWRGALGLSEPVARRAARAVGVVEIGMAAATLVRRDARWPFLAAAAAMPALAVGAAVGDRHSVTRAFNPVSLNLAVAGLAVVAWATADGRPSGRTPLRAAPDHQPAVEDVEAMP